MALPLGTLPVDAFSVGLRPMQKPVDDVELPGQIVRIHVNGTSSYGVMFRPLDTTTERKLRRIANG